MKSKKSVKDLLPSDRPREKMQKKGAGSLSNLELLAAILGSGNKGQNVFEVSKNLLKYLEVHSVNLQFKDISAITGIGPAKAAQILAAFELVRRYSLSPAEVVMNDVQDVLQQVSEIRQKQQEYFVVLTVNGAKKLIAKRTVFIGTLDQSIIHPREVFSDAITDRAAGVIFVHNHPSGSIQPSSDDIQTTKKLVKSGKILGIEVLDHIIVTAKDSYSFLENQLL